MAKEHEEQFNSIKKKVESAIKDLLTIETSKRKIVVDDVEVVDNEDSDDIPSQKKAKIGMRSWSVPVVARLKMIDKSTGSVISRKKMKIADLPKITARNSFIVDGTEYQVSNQLRMKSGAYVRVNTAGLTDEWVNLEKGKNFSITMDPKNRIIAKFDTTNVSVYSLAKILGVTDSKIKSAIGEDSYNSIVTANVEQDAMKLYKYLFRIKADNPDDALRGLREYFDGTRMDSEVTKSTLGKAYDRVNGSFVIDSIKKIISVNRGDIDPDNRDELRYKSLLGIDDLVGHRIRGIKGAVQFRVRTMMDVEDDLRKVVKPQSIGKSLKSFFNTSRLSDTVNQVNPAEMMDASNIVTYMGEGGISSRHQVTKAQRGLNNSFLGFIDPTFSPEGSMTGISNRLSSGVKKIGDRFFITVRNPKNGRKVDVEPMDLHDKALAFPGQYDSRNKPKKDTVTVVKSGKMIEALPKDVDYVVEDARLMFSEVQNMVPFLSSTAGMRSQMGAKMITQALPLSDPDIPVVKTKSPDGGTYEEILGKRFSVRAPVGGIIKSISEGKIVIETPSGKKHNVFYYDNFPMNGPVVMDSKLKVNKGDRVSKGDLIADSNFTKDGIFSVGKNLKVAYLPYKSGFTYEDGLAVSESAAKKLSSDKTYRIDIIVGDDDVLDKSKFRAYYPDKFTIDQMNKVGDDGLPTKGTVLEYGDPVHLLLRKKVMTEDDIILGRLRRGIVKPYKDSSSPWKHEEKGTVIAISRKGKEIAVYVRTTKHFEVGDKLSGRYGNKGIATIIVPDEEMLRTEDGEIIDLVIDPSAIPTRINPGQLLESAAAKASIKLGKDFDVSGFTDENYVKVVKDLMKEAGVSEKETLFDPSTGKSIQGVTVGNQFIMQLNHPVEKKLSARSTGQYSMDMAPTKGGDTSAQAVDPLTIFSLLSHGSRGYLREAFSRKNEKNDEFWRALQLNEPLPAPKQSFAWNKFTAMMRAMGINVKKEGNMIRPIPLTDDEILAGSSGKIKDALFIRGKDLKPEPGGFFDPAVTGGLRGGKWAHFTLYEEIPNPTFEQAIISVLGLKFDDFNEIVAGRKYVKPDGTISEDPSGGLTAGKAIRTMLSEIDIDEEIKRTEKSIKRSRGSTLNKANRKLRFLKNLKDLGLRPEIAYMSKEVPVIPPRYRPVYPHADGTLEMNPVNTLYRNLFLTNRALEDLKKLPDSEKAKEREAVYDSYKSLLGFGNPMTNRDYRGFFDIISGVKKVKSGFFQQKLLRRRQDLSGRSTITLDPTLHMDEAGIPEAMGWEIFKPMIVRELVLGGKTPAEAIKSTRDKTQEARRAMDKVTEKHPVLLNRSPSLHKFSIMAFRPRIHQGKSITINPLVTKGFGADFDGDHMLNYILTHISEDAKMVIDRNFGVCFLKDRDVTERMRHIVPCCNEDGTIHLFDLEDFPAGPHLFTKDGSNGPIEWHAGIPGIKVLSYNEENGDVSWSDVENFSVHPDREIVIVRLRSGREIITDDHPRAIYGVSKDSVKPRRFTPLEAKDLNVLVPRVKSVTPEVMNRDDTQDTRASRISSRVKLDFKYGYLVGSSVGDGQDRDIVNRFDQCTPRLSPSVSMGISGRSHDSYGESVKTSRHCINLATHICKSVEDGSRNKHLPSYFFNSPIEFREGLFAGLMDTDGSISISNAKKSPQLMASFSSISLRLIREVKLLAMSLGISSKITYSKTPDGRGAWILSFSDMDIYAWGGRGMVCSKKLDKLSSMDMKIAPVSIKNDILPITESLSRFIRSNIGYSKSHTREERTIYSLISVSTKSGYITRDTSERAIDLVGPEKISTHNDGPSWMDIVGNKSITWDLVSEVDFTGKAETGYDLTVPGYETFMNIEGVILSNTMSVYSVVTQEGIEDARKMLPSRNMLSTSGKIMVAPSQGAQLGLYMMTKDGKKTAKKYDSRSEAMKSFQKGAIKYNDVISIDGDKTTVGRIMINNILPDAAKDPDIVLDKKRTTDMLTSLAKNNPRATPAILDHLKDVGFQAAYEGGATISIDDIQGDLDSRDRILKPFARKISNIYTSYKGKDLKDRVINVISNANDKIADFTKSEMDKPDNGLNRMISSGARGSMDNAKQMGTAAVGSKDIDNNIVPILIETSYSEGMSPKDYWAMAHGARKGVVDRAVSTSEPGYLTKTLVHTSIDQIITKMDCGTSRGIFMEVDDAEILGRVLSVNTGIWKAGDVVTPDIAQRMKMKRIKSAKVRTPVYCEARKGICSMCFGLDENGEFPPVGTNIGVISAQSISEPATQLVMRCQDKDSVILVKDPMGRVRMYTHESFFNVLPCESLSSGDYSEKLLIGEGYSVMDVDGWTEIIKVTKHIPDSPMVMIRTESGNSHVVQNDHPMFVTNGDTVEKKLAVDLNGEDLIDIDMRIPWESEDVPHHEVDGYVSGSFVASGYVYSSGLRYKENSEKRSGVLGLCIVKGRKSMHKIMHRLRNVMDISPSTHGGIIDIKSSALASKFLWLFGNTKVSRKLPPEFIHYKEEWITDFLCGYIDSSGRIESSYLGNLCSLSSESRSILSQIQIILSRYGISSLIRTDRDCTERLSGKQCFVLEFVVSEAFEVLSGSILVSTSDNDIKPIPRAGESVTLKSNVCSVESVEYSGYVYDLATETTGYISDGMRVSNTFHTGAGVSSQKSITDSFQVVKNLLFLPKNMPGKAILSKLDGKVDSIEDSPLGGSVITIGGRNHKIPARSIITVKKGQSVKQGDKLTEGPAHPADVIDIQGIYKARERLSDELWNVYRKSGTPIQKKHFETISRSLLNHAIVHDSSSADDVVAGDVVPYDWLDGKNRAKSSMIDIKDALGSYLTEELPETGEGRILDEDDIDRIKKYGIKKIRATKNPISFEPIVKGVATAPLVRRDWLGQMAFNHLKDAVQKGIPGGWKSNIHETNPIPGLVYGTEFGQKKIRRRKI